MQALKNLVASFPGFKAASLQHNQASRLNEVVYNILDRH